MPKDATENCAAIARIIKDFCSCSEVGAWSPVMTEDVNTQRYDDSNRDAFLKTELTNMAAMKKRIISIAKRKGRHWRNQDKAQTTLAPIDEDKACNSFEEKDLYKPKHTTFEAQRRENTLIDIYTSSRNYSTCGENWSLSRVWKNQIPYGILNDLSYVPPELRTNSLKQPLIKPFTSDAHRSKTYGGRRTERNSFRSDRSHIIDRRQMKEQLRYDRNIKRHIRIRFMLSLRMRRYMKRKFPTLPERKPIMGDFQRSRANIPTKQFPRTNSSKWKTIDNSSFRTRSYRSVTSNLGREGIALFDVNEARNEVLSLCHDDWNDMDTLEIALLGGNFRSGRAAVGGWVRGRAMPSARAARAANGALALHYAAARGCLDCVRLLATTTPHASANTAMDNDVTPVYLAAQEGHLEVLKYLVLEAGGELNARARDGMQPVHASAQTGCLDCLKWMIVERGVDPNSRDGDGATPLHFAASRGHLPTVRWLLRHGARLHLDRHGKSPINDAADNHHVECLNVLVAAGAEAGAEGAGAKQLAAYKTVHACVCRPGDAKCILPGCPNTGARTPGAESRTRRRDSSERAPFYLHAPAAPTPAHAPSDGLYVNPMARKDVTATTTPAHDTNAVMSASGASSGEESSESAGGISRSDSGFYLHHVHLPAEPTYHRVRDLFEVPPPASRGRAEGEETPDNEMTVKAEMHSSSSGAGSDGSLSGASDASDVPDTPDAPDVPLVARLDADHHYEDIYLAREDVHRNRSNSRDSGSHSRSGSSSSSSGIVVKLSPQRTKSPTVTTVRDSHINAKGQKKHLSEDANRDKNSHATLQSKLSSLGAKASTFASKLASHASTINKSSANALMVSSGASSGVSSAGCSSDEAGGPPPPPPPPPQPRDTAPPALPVAPSPSDTPAPAPALLVEHLDHNTRTNGVRGRRNSIAGAAGSPTLDVVTGGANDRYSRATPNLVNKQLVLPFVPPSFPHQLQSNRLIKPSEYLRSITTSASSKYSSDTEDGYQPVEQMKPPTEKQESGNHNAPPPPPPPPQESPTTRKHQQPLSAISIQDLNSVQLRRTDKMMASKTLSAPARSMSMQCLATEPFQAQKTDLIAELKMSKDITGIKKMKVERAKIENMVDKDVYSEYTKQYTVDNFVDQVPERDASGNVIPAWKRQMLARRAAERARRDLERRVAGEAERRRALAVPAWKRQLLARREEAEHRLKSTIYQSKASQEACNGFMAHELSDGNCWRSPSQYGHQRAVSIDNINLAVDYEDHRSNGKHYNDTNCMQYDNNEPEVPKENDMAIVKAAVTNGNHNGDSDDDGRIIPWRAQLRKTNSKLNLLD